MGVVCDFRTSSSVFECQKGKDKWAYIVDLDGVSWESSCNGIGNGHAVRKVSMSTRNDKLEGKSPYNPESNPDCPLVEVEDKDLHGLAKEDCVTVWFFCWNWKVTVSPAFAVMLLGVKKSFPVPPTTTWWLLLRAGADEAAGAAEEVAAGVAATAAFALAWYVAS
jgi:hypothetical protein